MQLGDANWEMGKLRTIFQGILPLVFLGFVSGCTSDRFAREIPLTDARVLARYEVKTTHRSEYVSGYAKCSSWFCLLPETQIEGSYGSDIGSLFSGLSPVQALALRTAIANACKANNADFLLIPEYEMTTTSYWFIYESAKCTVRGLPAKFGELRQIPIDSAKLEIEL